ncbi:MAG: ABC transporter permease, partial [Pseudomonadota bacterium]|nr:ABC transporter permease [Pseudomonadota bacterium]
IGRNHPIGIVFAAIFFGGLLVGGRIMQFSPGVPLEMVRVVEGVIILTLAVPELKRVLTRIGLRLKRRRQRDGA